MRLSAYYFEAFLAGAFLAGALVVFDVTGLVVFVLRLRVLPNEPAKIFPRFVRLSPRPIESPEGVKVAVIISLRETAPEVEARILNDYYP